MAISLASAARLGSVSDKVGSGTSELFMLRAICSAIFCCARSDPPFQMSHALILACLWTASQLST